MKITFYSFSDRHSHLRERPVLEALIGLNDIYHNVICMPNLKNPVDDSVKFSLYKTAFEFYKPKFIPTLGLMLTKDMTVRTIKRANANGASFLKWIPAAASTHSQGGVAIDDIQNFSDCLLELQRLNMPFLVHLERATFPNGDVIEDIEREIRAIPTAWWLTNTFPGLKIVFEHASTQELIDLVEQAPDNVIATLTIHHALCTYAEAYDYSGKIINPFLFCRPSLKSVDDMHAVRQAMTSGKHKKFRFGSDSAYHTKEAKLNGMAGIFMPPPVAIPLLYQIFEEAGVIDNLQGFACVNETDRKIYDWDFPFDSTFTITDEEWTVPETMYGGIPFMAGEKLRYKILRQ